MLHRLSLVKPDGRRLWLYGRHPLQDTDAAAGDAGSPNPHLRWHPLRGEWIAYAGHRQHRTFLPGPESNPLAPSTDPARPSEVPPGDWSVAVFENRFPTLTLDATGSPPEIVPTRPARGSCEVVVFTQDPRASLGSLPLDHIELVLEVWAERYRELGSRTPIRYVMPFENRGPEVGVTLHHPHGQIYAYPFVPPVAARELDRQRRHFRRHGRGLLEDLIADEIRDGRRLVEVEPGALAFVPVCARYAYELWVAPRRAVPALSALEEAERRDLALVLAGALRRLDALWARPMPYIMVLHQAPTDGRPHPEAHAHFEIYPAYRARDRLKYLAGSELGAGVFTADTLPEEKAAELRAAMITAPA